MWGAEHLVAPSHLPGLLFSMEAQEHSTRYGVIAAIVSASIQLEREGNKTNSFSLLLQLHCLTIWQSRQGPEQLRVDFWPKRSCKRIWQLMTYLKDLSKSVKSKCTHGWLKSWLIVWNKRSLNDDQVHSSFIFVSYHWGKGGCWRIYLVCRW